MSFHKRVSSFSYKTLFLIIVFLLIPIVLLLRIDQKAHLVSAGWFDDSWHYRVAITITNNTNFNGTNIPYKYIFDTASLISTKKMQSNGNDIRIVDQNNKIVRYQVEQGTLNTTTTGLWFEASVPAKTSYTYYLYYGNLLAPSLSFPTDIKSDNGGTTVEMKDGFGYTTSTTHARISDIRLNGSNLGVNGNYHYTTSYPGNWWDDRAFTKTALASGPLFSEVKYEDTNYGNYSSYGTNIKMFSNGFTEIRVFTNYNTSGTENHYYYLHFDNGTRNSLWVDADENLVDQANNSGTLYQANLRNNWFGQRWTDTGNYGGTIITKNGADWYNGGTSAQASYYQTNYSYSLAYSQGSSREIRYGIFAGNGSSADMNQKASLLGNYSINTTTEEIGKSPIAYWSFDEGVGSTVHDSASSNHGVLGSGISAPTWTTSVSCVSGNCLTFDGNDYVFGTNDDSLQITTGTISAWIKTSDAGSSYRGILTKQSAYGVFLKDNVFMIFDWGSSSDRSTGVTLNDNSWHHIAVTFQSGVTNETKLWIDGKPRLTTTMTVDHQSTSVEIGRGGSDGGGASQLFSGLIDEVKIYPYARTEDEIKQDYNLGAAVKIGHKQETAQITPLKSKLVAHWDFDEGYGRTANNRSSLGAVLNGTFGTGNSAPTWSQNGKFGKALSFDGTSDYVVAPLSQITDFPFTLSVWAKYTGGGNDTLFTLGSSTDTNKFYSLWVNSSLLLNLGARNGSNADATATTSLDQNWHYLTAVFESSTNRRLYIDSKLAATSTTEITFNAGINQVRIGNCGVCCYTQGLLDEAKVYNYALTEDEIKVDYNQGSSIVSGSSTQDIGGTITSLEYCLPGDISPCQSPIARWDFNEGIGSSAFDTSGNENHALLGTGNSAPTWSTGKINKALSFDGTNDYIISDLLMSSPSTETLSLWIYPEASGVIVSELGQQSINTGYHYIKIGLNTNYELKGNFWACNEDLSFGTINLNQWHNITLVHDGSAEKAYLNGILKDSYTCSRTPPGNQYLAFGAKDTQTSGGFDSTEFFKGKIDQVRIYNYARTPAQIAWDYNHGKPAAWFDLDECSGSVVHDRMGTGTTGTINIGSSGTQDSLGTCSAGTSAAWTAGATGKMNSSLNFDGNDDYISVGDIGVSATALSFWIKPSSTTQSIIELSGSDNVAISSGNISVGGFGTETIYVDGSISSTIPDTNWHHIAIVSSVNIPANTVNIGKINTSYYSGQVDDVQIYNYSLKPEQIKTIYNGGSVNFK